MQTDFIKLSDNQFAVQGNLAFVTIDNISEKANDLLPFAQSEQRLSLNEKNFTIDFAGLTHCDSAGIALIIQWKKLAMLHQVNLSFLNITTQMQNLLNLMGLSTILSQLNNNSKEI